MRYRILATDYDGTLAEKGIVPPTAVAALSRLRESGRALVLVTGRELSDLRAIFPQIGLCDRVIAENGAVLHDPQTQQTRTLAEPPPPALLAALRAHKVPFDVGRVVVATREPHKRAVALAIAESGVSFHAIFNKNAVMVLPAGIDKATGLRAALDELGLPRESCVAVGDAENDHALYASCGLSVAVSNALPMLKGSADWVTSAAASAGVVEVIDALIGSDLRDWHTLG